MIDFGKIINDSGYAWSHDYDDVLTAKVPDLCPDCNGTGEVYVQPLRAGGQAINVIPCAHPNAPTIGDLLAIGAEAYDHHDYLWAVQK